MTDMTRVIIAGGRDFYNYALLKSYADKVLLPYAPAIEVFCGDAPGADALGKRYANEKGYLVRHFPADWDQYGKAAGPIRNRLMAEEADVLIAFWDMASRGTASMIEEARKKNLRIYVRKISEGVRDDGAI